MQPAPDQNLRKPERRHRGLSRRLVATISPGLLRLSLHRAALIVAGAVAIVGCRQPPSPTQTAPVPTATLLAPSPNPAGTNTAGTNTAAANIGAGTDAAPPPTGLLALPHATLVAMSDASSVLKPCGCTEELQRGGVERNARWLREAKRLDSALALVHAGNLLVEDEPPLPRMAAQRAMRQDAFVDVLTSLPVVAVALSSDDIERGGAHVKALLARSGLPLVADGWDHGVAGVAVRRLIKLDGGLKLAVFALDSAAGDLDAQNGLVAVHVAAARAEGADLIVALSNLGLRNSRRVARAATGLDAIVVGAVPDRLEQVEEADREGDVWLLETPRHGAAMAVLTIAMHGEGGAIDASPWLPTTRTTLQARIDALQADLQRLGVGVQTVATERSLPVWRRALDEARARLERMTRQASGPLPAGRLGAYRSVALPWTAAVDAATAAKVALYDAAVAKANQQALQQPLAAQPGVPAYVGAAVCLGCHQAVAPFARADNHAHAFATLERVGKAADLDCVGCHTTGWLQPGGAAFGNLSTFKNVQCEACHGPGANHVAAADKTDGAGLNAKPGAGACEQCHTPEHAPRFDFRAYVQRVMVPGHGRPSPR